MRYCCLGKCYHSDFPIPLLYQQPYTYWRADVRRHRTTKAPLDKQGRPKRVVRYTSEYKRQGLARCKNCVYITAKPTKPGVRCPCCSRPLSHSIRDKSNNQAQGLQNNVQVHGPDTYAIPPVFVTVEDLALNLTASHSPVTRL